MASAATTAPAPSDASSSPSVPDRNPAITFLAIKGTQINDAAMITVNCFWKQLGVDKLVLDSANSSIDSTNWEISGVHLVVVVLHGVAGDWDEVTVREGVYVEFGGVVSELEIQQNCLDREEEDDREMATRSEEGASVR